MYRDNREIYCDNNEEYDVEDILMEEIQKAANKLK
jgi:hypothetical protein